MISKWRTALRGGWLVLLGVTMVTPVLAESPNQRRREAEQLVTEALFHESLGLNAERERLLTEAEQKAPEVAALKWAKGQVKVQNRWVSIDDIPDVLNDSIGLKRYELNRSEYPDTAAGQLALARYCQRQQLDDQARAHLVRVLDHDANHAEARRVLGFVMTNGQWVHQSELQQARQSATQTTENFNRWRKKVLDLRHDLTARAKAQRAAAEKRLAAIEDPTAIPALETLLAYGPAEISEKAVATIGAMTVPDASLALARIAVYAPVREARVAAAKHLQDRPYEQFVPTLLAAMTTPFELREEVRVDDNGRLRHQQVLVREAQEQHQMLVRGTEYRRQAVQGGDQRFAEWQASLDIARQNADSTLQVAIENLNTLQRNERIGQVMAVATQENHGSDPKLWWEWWDKYNDLSEGSEKPVVTQVALRSVSVLDGIPEFSSGSESGSPMPRGECLVAGTTVRTSRGDVAIEQVRVGDLVLSQDINTGELAFKPVLRTTITPTGPLMKVEAGSDLTFRCTQGHLFWVSGEGWKQSRELKSGMQLHTPRGTVAVSQVTPDSSEQTYNLIVADFHTYFAGESLVLCHDNTLRRPTQSIVPGVK